MATKSKHEVECSLSVRECHVSATSERIVVMRGAAALVACAIWLGGCMTQVPSPTPQPIAGPCDPRQIRLTAGQSGAAAGSNILTFTATLTERPACLVLTWPGVEITDGAGRLVVKAEHDEAALPRTTILTSSLEFHLGWASACAPVPAGPFTAAVRLLDAEAVRLALPARFGPSGCTGGAMIVWVEPGWSY
jgi:hypothetical protein